jgi:predicted kinase
MGRSMKQVYMTIGLPGSGKSTWADEYVRNNPNTKRINKDSLRAMLDAGKWSKANEKMILEVRDVLILKALEDGYHVIIDDTNLAPKHQEHIRELVRGKAEVRTKNFTDVPLETCIVRDLKRPNSVGETVIRRMWKQFLQPKPVSPAQVLGPGAIIVDIDGTLALHNGRNPFDWDNCVNDLRNDVVYRAVWALTHYESMITGVKIQVLLVSGRDSAVREKTEWWLERNHIQYDQLWMRPEGDMRKDVIIKEEIYRREIEGKYNIIVVFDDRDQVVEFWRSLGLTCFQVAPGDF